jgi:hypothetical protein
MGRSGEVFSRGLKDPGSETLAVKSDPKLFTPWIGMQDEPAPAKE